MRALLSRRCSGPAWRIDCARILTRRWPRGLPKSSPPCAAVNIETKHDQSFTGIIAREGKSTVVLRDANGENEIKSEDIQNRASSGRSLMPEGFEALGAEGLRDLLAFVCAGESRFRVLD